MAQKKLLLLLVLLAVIVCNSKVLADANSESPFKKGNENWVHDLSQNAMDMTWQNLKTIAEETKIYGEDYREEPTLGQKASLMIFVSSSMPISLLKTYAKEAEKYGAVLVFKGLPGGSFKALTDLVISIQGESDNCPMQIDDEAFERYSINLLPSIVLAKTDRCKPWQTCLVTYDKIIGNIGIKAALERFSNDGELANKALEILKK